MTTPTANPSPAGKPWATSVVSRHTTGAPRASASATSGETRSGALTAGLPTQRDAARRGGLPAPRRAARSRSSRKPAANASPAPVVSTTRSTCDAGVRDDLAAVLAPCNRGRRA